MSGQHARGWFPARSRRQDPAPTPAAVGPPRRTVDREAVAAGLRARAALTVQADIPTTLLPALRAWTPRPAVPQDYAAEPVMPYWNPGRAVAVDLRGAGAWVTRQPPPPPVPFTSDYHGLPHFRATLRTAGWCGLAIRKGATS